MNGFAQAWPALKYWTIDSVLSSLVSTVYSFRSEPYAGKTLIISLIWFQTIYIVLERKEMKDYLIITFIPKQLYIQREDESMPQANLQDR